MLIYSSMDAFLDGAAALHDSGSKLILIYPNLSSFCLKQFSFLSFKAPLSL